MLVLIRRVNEVIMIGEDIRVSILGIDRNRVRVGVTAPRSVAVHREEVWQRIQRERNSEKEPQGS